MMKGKRAKNIIILGVGGNCIDILDLINEINESGGRATYRCIGFLDDRRARWGERFHGVTVLGPLAHAPRFADCYFVNGIGSPDNFWKKEAIIRKTKIPLEKFATLLHPTASVSRMARLGFGVVVLQHVTVASGATIGNHVIVLPNAVISHDDVIGDYTSIAGGVCISGFVKVGNASYLGTNSAIVGNITIGDFCLVGMGSVVLHDVGSNSVVVGNPARYLRNTK